MRESLAGDFPGEAVKRRLAAPTRTREFAHLSFESHLFDDGDDDVRLERDTHLEIGADKGEVTREGEEAVDEGGLVELREDDGAFDADGGDVLFHAL